ncbi:juxtaposed with another zinc finger protein 1 [Antrostomus carolinensis]|uniref:juxtaposed with another zinc finger protein 1 n=1 Tax=Antrostomus carolinensis TaxID=279965 RepID=UPI0010A98F66|nr:juxtaposed with another zinc finger protein 1 [Antrostomus carolinensis]
MKLDMVKGNELAGEEPQKEHCQRNEAKSCIFVQSSEIFQEVNNAFFGFRSFGVGEGAAVSGAEFSRCAAERVCVRLCRQLLTVGNHPSFLICTPPCSEYDEEEVDYEESDSDESWTTESAISSEAILSSMCMNGGDEKPFACPVPGCKKRYKNVNGIKYHAKNGHRTQIRVRKPFKCRCGKSYKTAQGLRHHTINFHPPVSAEIIRKMQQ